MAWTSLALIATGVVAAAAIVFCVRSFRRPVGMYERPRNKAPDTADRLHRRAADYRASGALPRWDP